MASKDAVVAQGLECSLCFDLLKDPKLLSCTHTFCQECLVRLYRSKVELHGNTLLCPLCREKTFITDGDVSKLKTNISIKGLVDNVKTAGKACSMCAPAAVVPAKKYCLEGCEYMCESCLEGHARFKKTSTHSLADIDQIIRGKVKVNQFCLKHAKEELKWFCLKCKVPICLRCRVYIHVDKDHAIEELSEYKNKFKGQIDGTLQKAEGTVKDIRERIRAVHEEKEKLDARFDGTIADIEQAYSDAIKQLDDKRNEHIAQCKRVRQELTAELDRMEDGVVKKLSCIESASELVRYGEKGLLEGNALAVHVFSLCSDLTELVGRLALGDVKPEEVTTKAEDIKFVVQTESHDVGEIVGVHDKNDKMQRSYQRKRRTFNNPEVLGRNQKNVITN